MDARLLQQAQELAAQMAGEVRTIGDVNDLIRLMSKSIIERALDAEMDVHLDRAPGAEAPSMAELPPVPAPAALPAHGVPGRLVRPVIVAAAQREVLLLPDDLAADGEPGRF